MDSYFLLLLLPSSSPTRNLFHPRASCCTMPICNPDSASLTMTRHLQKCFTLRHHISHHLDQPRIPPTQTEFYRTFYNRNDFLRSQNTAGMHTQDKFAPHVQIMLCPCICSVRSLSSVQYMSKGIIGLYVEYVIRHVLRYLHTYIFRNP